MVCREMHECTQFSRHQRSITDYTTLTSKKEDKVIAVTGGGGP